VCAGKQKRHVGQLLGHREYRPAGIDVGTVAGAHEQRGGPPGGDVNRVAEREPPPRPVPPP
jgi:hypothetical protein